MGEENDCQMFEKCHECHLRPFNQWCNCESKLLLCSFCARNHYRKIKDLGVENHVFSRDKQGDFETPICPFETEQIWNFILKTNAEMENIKNIKNELENRCSKWKPELNYNNYRLTKEEKIFYAQKYKDWIYWIGKIKEITNFEIERIIGFYSLHENLAKLLDNLSLISQVINYYNNENESQQSDIWSKDAGSASNTMKAILVFNGDYSHISSISNWFDILTMEDALNVLRTFLIMEYTFSISLINDILKSLREKCKTEIREQTERQAITQNQMQIFLKMCRKLRRKKKYISDEILNPRLELLQNDQDKALTIVSAGLLVKNTDYERQLENLIFGLKYWKIDNPLVIIYILMLQAYACKKVNDFQKAEELLNHALHELYEATGELHPLASECMIWLAESYMNNQTRWPYSLKLFEKALDLRMKNPNWYERDSIVSIINQIQYLRGSLHPK